MSRNGWSVGVLALVLLGTCGVLATRGQPTTSGGPLIETLEAQASQFFESISLGEVDRAYDELLARSPLRKQEEAIRTLKERTRQIKARFGEYRTFEQVGARAVGDDVMVLTYLYKCEQFPVVWHITYYYRPTDARDPLATPGSWQVISIRFDTEIEALAR